MSFFTAWGLVLLLFKCLGPFNVGVFSGYPYENDGCFSRTGRCIFLFSSIAVMLCSILAISQGLTKLQETADIIDATNQDVVKIHAEFKDLISLFDVQSKSAVPIRDQLVGFLTGDICPLLPDSNTTIRQAGQQTLSSLTLLEDFIAEDLQAIDKALRQVSRATTDVEESVKNLPFTKGASAAIMIAFLVIPSLLVVSLFFGWMETYYDAFFTFTEWFTMPCFSVMVIFAYVACGFIVMGIEGNADFCVSGSTSTPQSTILNILERYNLQEGELYYDVIKFYSSQCLPLPDQQEVNSHNPFHFLEKFHDDVRMVETTLKVMEAAISETSPANLSQQCGHDYSATLELVKQLAAHTTILDDVTERSLNLLRCRSIVPLYTQSVYQSVCKDNMTAALWLFSCSLLISFFGMVMITLRGSCYPLYIWDDTKDFYSTESSGVELEEISTFDDENDVSAGYGGDEGVDLYLDDNGGVTEADVMEEVSDYSGLQSES